LWLLSKAEEEDMDKKRVVWLCILCGILWLSAGAMWADTGIGDPKTEADGRTEVLAGVVVDYMGRIRFEVLDRDTKKPVAGASIEIYIESMKRYVLVGASDKDGLFEMDLAYNHQSGGGDGVNGDKLYLNSNPIRYQVYKDSWLPYPNQGTELIEMKEIPQIITVYLYQEDEEDPTTEAPTTEAPPPPTKGSGDDGPGPTTPTVPTEPTQPGPGSFSRDGTGAGSSVEEILNMISDMVTPLADMLIPQGGLPKTGVEGAMGFWVAGMGMFMLAGGTGIILIRKSERKDSANKGER